jgi:adenylate cyclase
MTETRKLAAIMAVDVVGYSRLMGEDEAGTARAVRDHREAARPLVAGRGGRIVKTMGDGLLLEFPSVVDAVECAIAIQKLMVERNADAPESKRIVYRIGVNLGDVLIEGDDIVGDGVNIAARLEGMCEPGGVLISGTAFDHVQSKIEATFVDLGEKDLKNIARPVRAYRVMSDSAAASTDSSAPRKPASGAAPLPRDIPSIAVLPFENMSGDADQQYFCDGLVDDILTSLSKLAGLRVIARHSSFAFKGRSVDVREVAKQLGVRYVLEGSVRKSGNRIRITAQLIDARDGSHIWAERYDRNFDDIFAVQDEITLVLATEMQIKLTEGEQARLRYTTTNNVAAWTLWVEGLSYYRRAISKENLAAARACWEKALALDPNSAALCSMLGWVHCLDARFGWWDDRAIAIGKAEGYLNRALSSDPNNPDALIASAGLLWIGGRFDEAVRDARRAAELAPGSADVANLTSFYLGTAGHPDEAITHSKRAIALNPNYPALYLGNLGFAYRLAGRVEEAITAFSDYDARIPGMGYGLSDLVILYGQSGRPEEACEAAKRLLAARPGFTVADWLKTQIIRDPLRLDADIGALRAAGLPAG